ncbi:hypothetical protein [Propionicicella superfundia]|uniref:hypothetical protein n=1 Tax=Propionicicella superfundia TaxID=348582 RepID=UPI0003F7EF5D|nr:hypothetical protein [Propionicicella superfundia]
MTTIPTAPGAIDRPGTPEEVMDYLGQLGDWLMERRQELSAIDAAVLRSPDRAALTADMALVLSVWQAVKDRYDALLTTWDSGRVGQQELLAISALLWGRLEGRPGDPATVAVSVPEGCRMVEALTNQLRQRLQVGPNAAQYAARIAGLRAQIDRIHDQIGLEPPAQQPSARAIEERFGSRLAAIIEKFSRGGDIGGVLSALEVDAARFERDLLVTQGKRRQSLELLGRARKLAAELAERQAALTELVARCIATVTPAPTYAVPQVSALGPVPNTPDKLDAYLGRLEQVDKAMDVVHEAYTAALADRDGLELAFQRLRLQTPAPGALTVAIGDVAARSLAERPCPVRVAGHLVDAYKASLDGQAGAV